MLLYYLEQTQLNLAPGLHFRIQLILLLTKGNHAVPAAVMAASAAALFTFALGLFWRRMAHSRNWAEGDCFDKKKQYKTILHKWRVEVKTRKARQRNTTFFALSLR